MSYKGTGWDQMKKANVHKNGQKPGKKGKYGERDKEADKTENKIKKSQKTT